VVVLADGGAVIGMGHVMRCLALADRLAERGAVVTFVTRAGTPAVLAQAARHGCAVRELESGDDAESDLGAFLDVAGELDAAAAVVDVYGFGIEGQIALRAAGLRLAMIDDAGGAHFVADVVVNQNIHARREAYTVAPHTRLLLGPRYALLRRAFVGRTARPVDGAPRILITMGGGDADNVTLRVLRAADRLDLDVALDVVVGPAFGHLPTVTAAAREARHPVQVHQDPQDLAGLMTRATVALSAAGSTCWELAHLGVPAVLLVLAENQVGVAAGLHAAGFAVSLGEAAGASDAALREALATLLADPARRAAMAQAGRRLVDGAGAVRVAAELMPA